MVDPAQEMRLLAHYELPQIHQVLVDLLEAGLQHANAVHVEHIHLKHQQGDVYRQHLEEGIAVRLGEAVRCLRDQEEEAEDVLGMDHSGHPAVRLRGQFRGDLQRGLQQLHPRLAQNVRNHCDEAAENEVAVTLEGRGCVVVLDRPGDVDLVEYRQAVGADDADDDGRHDIARPR